MPVYEPRRLEYAITNGMVNIRRDNGVLLPAYWSHPELGRRFPGVALLHDWWGITDTERQLANLLAQLGYYVIVPDFFNGHTAQTPREALALVEALGNDGFRCVNTTLLALERHNRTTGAVAAIGLGMGGSLAFEAAVEQRHLKAAVSCYGFPNKYFGRFHDAPTPILALYGEHEPHVPAQSIARLERELGAAVHAADNRCVRLEGAGRELFNAPIADTLETLGQTNVATTAWKLILDFLERFVPLPAPPARPVF